MMNSSNKQRIDAARDVLVGIVPDPKGQVEQITTALIYKYLAEQDESAAKIPGGRRSYFVGKYAKFSWAKILSPTLEGDKQLSLYRDAMESMGANPKLPEIFRQMLRGAHSPFRDARVLKLFLKEIDELDCRHTEDLGNAYEHLLSIMGTQGDAGQFRTPRNIINFIVAVVNPQIGERILDPACGSAGFLVAAHEHIMKANTGKKPGDKLSIAQKRNLPKNISGYDIDPGMTRLAMVNLYLHGVKEPQVRVYDTLSDDALWAERYDVILANPPFMTPRGGIQPHDRFAVRANRAEVLFVDYIAEHLSPQGRAGIIVPEGIVFQSGRAYKELRKNLVEQWGLYAVASLPAGVFNPYSGVKTSVLFLDRKHKTADSILFVKVENDGFDLGAKRMQIDKDDLPEAKEIIYAYGKNASINNNRMLVVDKKKIAEDGDYSFVSERYREIEVYKNVKYDFVKIGDIFDSGRGRVISKKYIQENEGDYPVYSSQTTNNGVLGKITTYDFDGEYLTWTTDGANAGKVFYRSGKFNCTNVCGTLKLKDEFVDKIDLKYIAPILDAITENFVVKVGNPKLMNKEVERIKIPLPSLEIQEKIVAEISGYEKVRDNAQAVVDNWRPVININPDWPVMPLGKNVSSQYGYTATAKNVGDTRYLRITDINENGMIKFTGKKYINADKSTLKKYVLSENDIVVARSGSIGRMAILADMIEPMVFASYLVRLKLNKSAILPKYLFYFSHSASYWEQVGNLSITVAQPNLNAEKIKLIKMPLPSITEQKRIVAEIESEQQAVNGCRVLVEKMERKIADKIAEVWKAKK